MKKKEGKFLQKRAEEFLENAKDLLAQEKYALAAFNFEQSAQLFLKYFLFTLLGDFPKTHSLKRLLKETSEITNKTKVEKFMEENADVLANLENAYLTSRYFPVEFERKEVENMREFVKTLLGFLEKL